MAEDEYKITIKYGSVEFAPCIPGHTRLITRDAFGAVTKDVTCHYVCLSLGSDTCIYCGAEMHTKQPRDKPVWWHRLLGIGG